MSQLPGQLGTSQRRMCSNHNNQQLDRLERYAKVTMTMWTCPDIVAHLRNCRRPRSDLSWSIKEIKWPRVCTQNVAVVCCGDSRRLARTQQFGILQLCLGSSPASVTEEGRPQWQTYSGSVLSRQEGKPCKMCTAMVYYWMPPPRGTD